MPTSTIIKLAVILALGFLLYWGANTLLDRQYTRGYDAAEAAHALAQREVDRVNHLNEQENQLASEAVTEAIRIEARRIIEESMESARETQHEIAQAYAEQTAAAGADRCQPLPTPILVRTSLGAALGQLAAAKD